MSYRRTPFAVGEFYHCYTRGIDKRITFQDTFDHERFLEALYVCNGTDLFRRDYFSGLTHSEIFSLKRGDPLVSIIAYSLMPNHYHLLLHEITENGVARFMQKVGTMYTMYFNAKYERVGSLFVGPFRSKHIHDDMYLKRVIPYIHLNPVELLEPRWKEGVPVHKKEIEKFLSTYKFNSLFDYEQKERVEKNLLDFVTIKELHASIPDFSEIFLEASEYYKDLRW